MKKPIKDYITEYPQDISCEIYSACESSNCPAGPCYPGSGPMGPMGPMGPIGGWR